MKRKTRIIIIFAATVLIFIFSLLFMSISVKKYVSMYKNISVSTYNASKKGLYGDIDSAYENMLQLRKDSEDLKNQCEDLDNQISEKNIIEQQTEELLKKTELAISQIDSDQKEYTKLQKEYEKLQSEYDELNKKYNDIIN